jgi:hypothetical protein
MADNSTPISKRAPNIAVLFLLLDIVGCLSLSILVITISLSQRLLRRDPVVNNFLYTWILLSASAAFEYVSGLLDFMALIFLSELTVIAQKEISDATLTRERVLIFVYVSYRLINIRCADTEYDLLPALSEQWCRRSIFHSMYLLVIYLFLKH